MRKIERDYLPPLPDSEELEYAKGFFFQPRLRLMRERNQARFEPRSQRQKCQNWDEIFAALDRAEIPSDFFKDRDRSEPQER